VRLDDKLPAAPCIRTVVPHAQAAKEDTMRMNAVMIAALGATALAAAAPAAFTGLSFIGTETTLSDGSPIWVTRLYANFNDPTDRLLSITGASISASQALYQSPFGTGTEPSAILLPLFPDLAFDSFVTMNRFSNSTLGSWTPPTSLEPGSVFSATGFTGGWFTDGDSTHTTGSLSYLIAQLSIEDYTFTSSIQGTMTIAWKTATGGAIFSEGSFAPPLGGPIPAPAALPLLAIAGLAVSRRR
jgi:hypothetical protein